MKSIRSRRHEEEDKIVGLGQTLSLIDHHIENLRKLSFPPELVQLNVHCNKIKKIENFENLVNLQLLDLSSNEIEKIEGLEHLANLKVLNLSCNQIEVISGLGLLRRLEKLDVSYNSIHDLTGFKEVKPKTHNLNFIELHGNQITSLSHVIGCLANCGKLDVLTLKKNGDGNSVCNVPAYVPSVFAQLPNLTVLDGKDRHGNVVTTDQLETVHPGLDEYLQWLVESNPTTSTAEESGSLLDFTTPKIDEVLQRFRRHRQDRFAKPMREADYGSEQESASNHVTERLGLLEKQIDSLVKMQIQKQMIPEKDTATTTSTESKERLSEPTRLQRAKNRKVQGNKGSQSKGKRIGQETMPLVRGKATKVTSKSNSGESQPTSRKVRDPKDDEAALMMIKELDEERERRWKAEQAARKLVITVKEMQEKLSEERKIAEAAITTSTRLKNSLTSEKEARVTCEKVLKEKEVKFEEMSKQLEMLRNEEEDAKRVIESLEETSRNSERERLKVQTLKDKQLQEAQYKAAASIRETELLQGNVKNLKDKVLQLQELLANREQDHKVTLAGMVKLDGKEIKSEIEKEMAKQEGRYSQLIQQYNERLEARNRDYALLEDEFRAGLQMEANRFSELQEAYTQIVNENSELRKSFQLIKQKEGKSTSLVTELTSMVKEQKGRLEELSKSKQEMQSDYKERLQLLQNQLESGRRQLSKMETARQEKDKLLAQVKAQESVIEGLRTERKLWGQELAQQGASLAQDRGRLEAQIESLTSQVKQLRQKEQENIDALKIKVKLIEDQTDTIKKLKKETLDGKSEIKKVKEELISERKSLEVDLEDEKKNSLHLQEELEALSERKIELKSQLSISLKELEETKEELRNLKSQWKERSQIIDTLEEKVMKMKENYDNKEKKLKEERDTSLKSANSLREKLKTCDDAFRRQTEEQNRENELEIRRIISSKNDEIEQEKQKVLEVENEMRIVLEESVVSKKNFEMKIKQLSKAFADIQTDLTSSPM